MKNLQYYLSLPKLTGFAKEYREHFMQTFSALKFIKTIRAPSDEMMMKIRVQCPKLNNSLINKNRTIVLDLDETLIHVSKDGDKSDFKIPVKFKDGTIIQLGVIYRPFLIEVLEKLSL